MLRRLVWNQNYKVISLWINENAIHIMQVLFYSLYHAVLNTKKRSKVSKYHFLSWIVKNNLKKKTWVFSIFFLNGFLLKIFLGLLHHFLWHAWNYWDPLTCSTINCNSLPTVGEELCTNGHHTVTYTNRFQFEQETTVTLSKAALKSSWTI